MENYKEVFVWALILWVLGFWFYGFIKSRFSPYAIPFNFIIKLYLYKYLSRFKAFIYLNSPCNYSVEYLFVVDIINYIKYKAEWVFDEDLSATSLNDFVNTLKTYMRFHHGYEFVADNSSKTMFKIKEFKLYCFILYNPQFNYQTLISLSILDDCFLKEFRNYIKNLDLIQVEEFYSFWKENIAYRPEEEIMTIESQKEWNIIVDELVSEGSLSAKKAKEVRTGEFVKDGFFRGFSDRRIRNLLWKRLEEKGVEIHWKDKMK